MEGVGATGGGKGSVLPEPSTCVAGVLLLLPFGASTIRSLLEKQAGRTRLMLYS